MIHIHSTYSDGLGSIETIARIGGAQGLDYLILTDHDTLQGKRDGKEGRYGGALVLNDEEISTTGGHYLALRLKKEIPRLQDPRWTMEAVSAAGGLGFIAHPFWPRRPWKDPEAPDITGLEIYSAAHDVSEENFLILGFWTLFAGSEASLLKWLDRQDDALALWDKLLARGQGRVVGIGSPDAHGLRRFGLQLGPYATMFKLVRNHLLVKEVSAEEIYRALAEGHLFVAHDMVADSKGFSFVAIYRDSIKAVMGDAIQWRPGLELYAYLPSPGKMKLFKDGRPIAQAEGQHGWFRVSKPGIYRLEATRGSKPWIYSNPIYVVE